MVGYNHSYKPITNTAWVRARLCKLQKGCTRLAAACDKVYLLLAHGQWFSPGTPASSTTKTGRHDIAEILLKVALKHQKSKSSRFVFLRLRPPRNYLPFDLANFHTRIKERSNNFTYQQTTIFNKLHTIIGLGYGIRSDVFVTSWIPWNKTFEEKYRNKTLI